MHTNRSIHTGHLPHPCLLLQPKSFGETKHWWRGVNDTSPTACFCTCPVRHCRKMTSIIRHLHIASCNAWLGRTTIRLRWTASACEWGVLCRLTTRSCSTVFTTKQQIITLPSTIGRTINVMRCYFIVTQIIHKKWWRKKTAPQLGVLYQVQETTETIRKTQYTRYHRTTA